jgi:hypothetical protein
MRRKSGGYPPWHSLAGGPRSLEQLAERVGYGAFYQVFYRDWSRTAHAEDAKALFEPAVRDTAGRAGLRGLRGPGTALRSVTSFTASMMVECTQRLLAFFRPGEEQSFAGWYTREVRPTFLAINEAAG